MISPQSCTRAAQYGRACNFAERKEATHAADRRRTLDARRRRGGRRRGRDGPADPLRRGARSRTTRRHPQRRGHDDAALARQGATRAGGRLGEGVRRDQPRLRRRHRDSADEGSDLPVAARILRRRRGPHRRTRSSRSNCRPTPSRTSPSAASTSSRPARRIRSATCRCATNTSRGWSRRPSSTRTRCSARAPTARAARRPARRGSPARSRTGVCTCPRTASRHTSYRRMRASRPSRTGGCSATSSARWCRRLGPRSRESSRSPTSPTSSTSVRRRRPPGASSCIHIPGITPEAPTLEAAFDGGTGARGDPLRRRGAAVGLRDAQRARHEYGCRLHPARLPARVARPGRPHRFPARGQAAELRAPNCGS